MGTIKTDEEIRRMVSDYYDSLEDGESLRTNACDCASTPPKYVLDVLKDIDPDIIAHFYGCGSPLPPALEGCTVLDLGCGTGRDVYVAAKLVGPNGHVIGVDMTPSQLEFARSHEAAQIAALGLDESNVEFIESYIEDGNQKISEGTYGKSITDACLGWEKSEKLVLELADLL